MVTGNCKNTVGIDQSVSRKISGPSRSGGYAPVIFLVHSWGSLFGVPLEPF